MLSAALLRASQQHYQLRCGHLDEQALNPASLGSLHNNTHAQVGVLTLGLAASTQNCHAFRGRIIVSIIGHIENLNLILSKLDSVGYAANLSRAEEVVAALIDWHSRSHKDLLVAIREALAELQGYFSCCVYAQELAPSLICCSKGPQLYISQNSQGNFVCSDRKILKDQSSLFITLDSDELAQITPQQIFCFDYAGQVRHKDPTPHNAILGTTHHMLDDIFAQAMVAADLIELFLNNQLASVLNELGQGHAFERILLLASGSSHHAALSAQYWIEQIAALPCKVEYSSEYRDQQPLLEPNTLVIAISQSGQTADTVAALRLAKATGYQETLVISNQKNSPLAKLAKYEFLQYAGPELSTASTKTYTSQLLCLYFIAIKLAEGRQRFNRAAIEELHCLPLALSETLQLNTQLKTWAQRLAPMQNLFVIGKHSQLPIAFEAAQKFKEVCYIHAEAYPSGELKHGPVALIDHTIPVIACLPWDVNADKMLANLHEVKSRKGDIYLLTDIALSSSEHFYCIQIPRKMPHLNPILYGVAFQLLSYLIAISRGNDVDAPRNLSKAQAND